MTIFVPAPPTDPPKALDGSRRWGIRGSHVLFPWDRFEFQKNLFIAVLLDLNTIKHLKALDEGFSSKNYVRKFLRALHPKWSAKVMAIEESKDLSSLALDELIGNLKVHEVVMEKDSKIYKGKKERIKSIALKDKKESSDDETLTSKSDDEEYAMAERVTENVLDAVIQIISLAIVQNHLATKSKRPSLKVLRAIAKMTPKIKLTTKLVSWLNRQMRLQDSKPTKKPMSKEIKLTKDDEADSVDSSKYQESRYAHEGRTIDTSFYNDLSDGSVAKFTVIGFDCLLAP
ncbi:hypothetical protein Tco_0445278 [Tanacetum coccineum]